MVNRPGNVMGADSAVAATSLRAIAACLVVIAVSHSGASGQSRPAVDDRPPEAAPEWMENLVPRADDPRFEAHRALRKRLVELERTLNGVRARHFGQMRHEGKRAEGVERMLATLHEFDDAASYPVAIKAFEREGEDVRVALLGYFESRSTPEADAAIAWLACLGRDEALRAMARDTLVRRADARDGAVDDAAKYVLDQALRASDEATVVASVQTLHALRLYEAIPLIVMTQVQAPAQSDSEPGARAWIFVGSQRAYVSDLTPVVGTGVAAFDPQISVLNTGALLVIRDSLVTIYRTEVHAALVAFTTEAWGRSTAHLGYDVAAWRRWHAEQFLPHLERVRAEQEHADTAVPIP